MTFQSLFHPDDPERSRYLTGLFNLFARETVRCWADDSRAPYANLGKPILRQVQGTRGSPLDFAFEDRRKKQAYAVIMYCDPLNDTPLANPAQIEQFSATRTFAAFLEAAVKPDTYRLALGSTEAPTAGSILIWSSIESRKARALIRKTFSFYDVLSMEVIIQDLIQWQNREFQMLLDRRAAWSHDLFRGLRRLK